MVKGREVIINRDSIKLEKLQQIFGITHHLLQMMIRINFHIPEGGMKIIILENTLAIDIAIEKTNNLSMVELNNTRVVCIKIEKINNKIENLKNNFVVDMNL